MLAEIDRIDLVDGHDDVGDLHHRRHGQVATGLLDHAVAGVNQNNDELRGGQARDGVARVLHVPRGVGQDEAALVCGEVTVGHVDGDALLALGAQAIDQQREVRILQALGIGDALYRFILVGQDGLRIVQQAAHEGGLAVVDRAGGAQAEGRQVGGHQK